MPKSKAVKFVPETKEELDLFLLIYKTDSKRQEVIEALIKEKNNGKVPNIRKPNEYNRYYACDLPRVNGKQKKIQKATRLEVLKGIYLFFYGTECKEKKIYPTFEEAYKEWIQFCKTQMATENTRGISSVTVRRYESDYTRFFGNAEIRKKRINKITAAVLYDELLSITKSQDLSKKACKNMIGYVNKAFKYSVGVRYIKSNPVDYLDRLTLVATCKEDGLSNDQERILKTAELNRLKKVLLEDEQEYPQKPVNYAIELALCTGIQVGDLVALKWADIVDNVLLIERSEHQIRNKGEQRYYIVRDNKPGNCKKVLLSSEALDIIDRLQLATHRQDDGFLFMDETGKRVTANIVQMALKRRGDRANVAKLSIDLIRRTVSCNTALSTAG